MNADASAHRDHAGVTRGDLIRYLESGSKPDRSSWAIGSEHEKFIFHRGSHEPLSYEGEDGRPGIRHVLEAFVARGWRADDERHQIIAATKDGASITLEPGGQFELSGAPLESIHQTCDETTEHLRIVREIGDELNIGFLGLGFHPTLARADVPVMPKRRYDIMRAYMPTKGSLGLDMMLRTCTVQVNLDFASEADMVEKFRLSLALQPIATALFASSPFKEGADTGFASYRSHIWTDTDPDRCGMLPFVFEDGMGFERWADYLLSVPMYFIRRGGKIIDASGQSFRDFLNGKLPAMPGELPTLEDFKDHMTTVFPEVRLKTFLEMRGADAGPWSNLCALPALWVGLLYDQSAQDEAAELVKDWSVDDMQALRDTVPKVGLRADFKGRSVLAWADDMVKIAAAGLLRRNKLSAHGTSEQVYLKPLIETLRNGESPADRLRRKLADDWGGNISAVFEAERYR